MSFLFRALGVGAVAAALTLSAVPAARAEFKGLEIIAPASPGGGWDQHARAVQQMLQNQGLASGVQVSNIPGAGGTIGLAQFVTGKKRGPAILVGGQIMVGAIISNKSAVTLDQVTPLARLTAEYTVIAVAADSPIKSFEDVLAKFKADPGSVSWGGGSAGGSDQILAGLIAKEVGVAPTKVNYIATAGGGELLAAALGGHVTLAMGGYYEFKPQFDAGKLRPVAISAPARLAGTDVPTLKEKGVNLEFANWRGLFMPATLKPADKKEMDEAIKKATASDEWQALLKTRGWMDYYQGSDQFAAFLKEEQTRIATVLKDLGLAN
jgi:putative tricarboxylic transport membrane protein